MANSRSNIYPVQLQGAELNLNKFDAEIKQYSGFNKNNSPFVGGCLSNLFTKTEENTTGSSDSVYVDDNGDVYEAKTDGLYKNGEKIIEPYEGAFKVFEREELDIPRDAVYARCFVVDGHKDVFYILKEGNSYRFVSNNINVVFTPTYSVSGRQLKEAFFDVEKYNDRFYIAARCVFVNYLGALDMNKYFAMYITDNSASIIQLLNDEVDQVCDPGSPVLFNPKPVVVIQDSYVYFLFNQKPIVSDAVQNWFVSVSSDDIQPVTYSLNATDAHAKIWESHTYERPYSSYILLKDRCAYFIGSEKNISLSSGDYIVLKCGYTLNAGDIRLDLIEDKKTVITAKFSSATTISYNAHVGRNYYMGRYGAVYGIYIDNRNLYGICDYGVDSVTFQANGYVDFMLGAVAGGFILVNNSIVTGLCLPYMNNYWGYGETLVTEWNSVDGETVSCGVFSYHSSVDVMYKDINTEKWIRVYLSNSKPKIKKIYNQLVLNVMTGKGQPYNSYRLSDGRLLQFANAWNNRAPAVLYGWLQKLSSDVTENSYYIATSVNEYNLKDNASLLLNPIACIVSANVSIDITFTNNYNLYEGKESAVYTRTIIDFAVFNTDLKDLPFPINTSGNVQLSPSLFCESKSFGNDVFIKEGSNAYQLIKDGAESVMSYYLGTLIENLEDVFILQGQYYAIINKQIFNVQFSGGVVQSLSFVVSVENLQFCGNSAYQAYFFSKTNRCIYVFTGANILNQLQLVDKISEIYAYKYNQSTQSIILITDIGTIVSSNLGMYLIEGFTPDDVFFYDKGVVFVSDSELTYLQYYEADGFEKHNIEVETCFYGMNNETVTINDCLYFRLFSEEHEEGEVKVSATTISLKGRKTETTVFKFKASDWDALTHSVYVRYQPKEQRGLGISFSIDSPFKIASLSVGSKADAILVDKVSKGAVITPSNNDEW